MKPKDVKKAWEEVLSERTPNEEIKKQIRNVIRAVKLFNSRRDIIVCMGLLKSGKSTLVNLLTLLWVLSSSCIYIIMQSLIVENADALAQELTDTVSEYLTGDLDSQAKAATGAFNAMPFLKVVSSVSSVIIGPVLEASAAGANTYITDKMYIWKLKSEDISLKKYLNERNRARMITCGYLMKAAPGVTQFRDAIAHGIKKN